MIARRERLLAGLAVGAIVLAWFALILSACYVPRLAALWADLGQPLSAAQRLLLTVSALIDHALIVLAPALLLATIAAVTWRIRVIRRERATAQV